MRGSASMLFGRGSTGGVVNQVTKQPILDNQHEAQATVDSKGYLRSTGDFNLKTGDDAALRINVMGTKAANGGATIDKCGIAPTYRWGIGARDEFSVGLFHLNVDNVPMSAIRYLGGNVPDIKPGNFYGTKSSGTLGAYAQDLVQVAPGWKLLGGIRYDSFKGDFSQTAYPANAASTQTKTSLSDGTFSYRTGVLYQPSPTSSYHFSYGTSFNTSADTYQFVTPLNANTPPEKSRNIELGAKLDWLDR